ncbi:MAG: DUF1475 family protein [Bacteroidetes bacterium]|nr:DUF1475 family protein [Bacteroidota bacterium]
MIVFLRVLFSILLVWMSYQVIDTSLRSNLFEEWDFLAGIPWMKATLWDFYTNVLFIFIWVCYKENNWGMRILWLILLCCLGSIATCIYVLIQLFRIPKDAALKTLFVKS